MSIFNALSRANREIQLDNWMSVHLDHFTVARIHRDQVEEGNDLEDFQTGDSTETIKFFLEAWCRKTIKGGFAIKADGGLTLFFQRPSEAVRFKLHWGGR